MTRNDDLKTQASQVAEEAKPLLIHAIADIKKIGVASAGVKTAENLHKIDAFAAEKGPLLIALAKNHL